MPVDPVRPADALADALADAFAKTLARISEPGWSTAWTGAAGGKPPAADGLIGTELDALAEVLPPQRWEPNRLRLHEQLRRIVPRHKLAVLGMARDEAPHLAEWIAHYLAIGAEHIFIYSNDNTDGTEELLQWFGTNAPVTPLFTTAAPDVNIQRKNYQHAFFLLPELRLYEWVLVVDADEFLVPDAKFGFSLPRLLDAAPPAAAGIVFPWLWRLWERRFERRPGLLAERFPHAVPHALFKSVVRLNQVVSLCEVHVPTLEPGAVLVDSAFQPLPPGAVWTDSHKSFAGGMIDHYWARSFEEFVAKKRRGDALALSTGHFRRDYETFFSWTAASTPANFVPVPPAVIAGMWRILQMFSADPNFATLTARLQARYQASIDTLRADAGLRALFDQLDQSVAAAMAAAPSAVVEPALLTDSGKSPEPALPPALEAEADWAEKVRQVAAAPTRPSPPGGLIDLALHRRTSQSSVSEWSRAPTVEADSAGAVSGALTGSYSFHTALQHRPWWRVDLGALAEVGEIRIYNRLENLSSSHRCLQFAIEFGLSMEDWQEVFRKADNAHFGGADGAPFIWRPAHPVATRHVRIRLLGENVLHYDAVEVFGRVVQPA